MHVPNLTSLRFELISILCSKSLVFQVHRLGPSSNLGLLLSSQYVVCHIMHIGYHNSYEISFVCMDIEQDFFINY